MKNMRLQSSWIAIALVSLTFGLYAKAETHEERMARLHKMLQESRQRSEYFQRKEAELQATEAANEAKHKEDLKRRNAERSERPRKMTPAEQRAERAAKQAAAEHAANVAKEGAATDAKTKRATQVANGAAESEKRAQAARKADHTEHGEESVSFKHGSRGTVVRVKQENSAAAIAKERKTFESLSKEERKAYSRARNEAFLNRPEAQKAPPRGTPVHGAGLHR